MSLCAGLAIKNNIKVCFGPRRKPLSFYVLQDLIARDLPQQCYAKASHEICKKLKLEICLSPRKQLKACLYVCVFFFYWRAHTSTSVRELSLLATLRNN